MLRLSLPTRERGLKFSYLPVKPDSAASLPTRERGLKSAALDNKIIKGFVAPYTGAWIEIILWDAPAASAARSLPTRERGLKFRIDDIECHKVDVAPYTGAWIEISVQPQ